MGKKEKMGILDFLGFLDKEKKVKEDRKANQALRARKENQENKLLVNFKVKKEIEEIQVLLDYQVRR